MAEVSEWGITASDNNVTSPDGAQTGWVGADVGPWARETMAAVARAFTDLNWVNITKYGLDPTGTKTIARSSNTQIEVTAGTNWGASTTDIFAPGRIIRIQQTTGAWHYAFITGSSVATTTLTLDLSLIGTAALTAGWAFNDNAIEFYAPLSEITTDKATQILSPIALGGIGTSTERDTRVPDVANAPAGVVWMNTTDSLLQVITGTAGSRSWKSIAPLISVWSDKGGDLTLTSTGQSKATLNSATGGNSAVVLQENSTQRGQVIYDASGNAMIFEGGATSGTAGRVYIKDADGKAYYRNWSGGTPGSEYSLTPEEVYPWPATILRVRTGAGAEVTVPQAGTWVEACKGALPASVQALLESSDWDELKVDLIGVITSYFISVPSIGAVYTFNLFLGSGYDSTPPGDLSTGYTKQFTYTHSGEDPYEGLIDTTETGDFAGLLLNADISGTIDSFYLSVKVASVGNDQTFTWKANEGNRYSSITFRDVVRVVS